MTVKAPRPILKRAAPLPDKAPRPIPASIPMPDSPIRLKIWYQIYVRLARPSLAWVGVGGAIHSFGLLDRWLPPVDDGRAIIILGFVAALHGVQTFEKTKGVA